MPSEIRPIRIDRGDPIPAAWLNKVADAVVQRITVERGQARRVGTGVVIAVDPPRSLGQPRWFKITGSTSIATNRWKYTANEVRPDDEGKFAAITDGKIVDNLFNSIEANNTGDGIEGHGVDVDGADYPAGFTVKPIADDAVVLAWPVRSGNSTNAVQWMTMVVNADDGTCS